MVRVKKAGPTGHIAMSFVTWDEKGGEEGQ